MATTYTPLRQDNGIDSWIAVETDGDGQVVSKYMVYDNPYKKASIRELEKLSAEDIVNFKSLIGVDGGGGGSVTLTSGEGIDVVDMELFAIANIAYQFNIPWQSFKFVTDDANTDSGNEWTHRVNHGQELYLDKLKDLMSA
jgi:hypothetical protein